MGVTEVMAELERLTAAKDAAYAERNQCVAMMAKMARVLGLRAGLGKHEATDANWESEWRNIVFIELPAGQCSWHIHDRELPLFSFLPSYEGTWDGHSYDEKYARMRATVFPEGPSYITLSERSLMADVVGIVNVVQRVKVQGRQRMADALILSMRQALRDGKVTSTYHWLWTNQADAYLDEPWPEGEG